MKFNGSIEINKPLDKVVELFLDQNNLKEWQEGFVSKKLVSGTDGQKDAVSKIQFKQGKREMELTETITNNNLPHSIEAFYHHEHMDNSLKTSFTAISESVTKYEIDGEYIAFRGFIPKLMAKLFPSIFRKQAEKWVHNFKRFVEEKET